MEIFAETHAAGGTPGRFLGTPLFAAALGSSVQPKVETMKLLCSSALIVALSASGSGSALAQDRPDNRPETKAPATDVSRPGSLSDKLSETGGVIHPSGNVDPHIDKPAPVPDPGSTPVIKPPGTGGRPGATPK